MFCGTPAHKALRRFAAIVALVFFGGPAWADKVALPDIAPAKLVAAMREGGNVIYIRHTVTDREGADQVKAELGNCATQRTLSARGWADARTIGAAFVALEIPVGEVISSEYCRAWQTAEIAFGRTVKRAELNFERAEEYTAEQKARMRERVRAILSRAPSPGFNTVVVGHDDPFDAATGHYPEPMGKTVVVRPDGRGGFALLGGVDPQNWWAVVAAVVKLDPPSAAPAAP
jgi:broad specificity phosphatase PhoE